MREENHADTWTEISYLETFKHRTRRSKQHHMPVTSSTRQPRAWNPRWLVVSVIPTTYSQLGPETHTQLEPSARSALVPFGFCQAKVPAQEELVLPTFHHQNTKATENRTRFSGTSLEDLTTTSALLWHAVLRAAVAKVPARRPLACRLHAANKKVHLSPQRNHVTSPSVTNVMQMSHGHTTLILLNGPEHKFQSLCFRPTRRDTVPDLAWNLLGQSYLSHLFRHIRRISMSDAPQSKVYCLANSPGPDL